MKELIEAVNKVMIEIKGIDKNMTVGSGSNSYSAVSDYDVKKAIGKAMAINNLACFPIEYEEKTTRETWEEKSNYGTKTKSQVFVEIKAKYRLIHSSGQSIDIVGYGHGIDSQDKAAGKATTYALKNALLYSFLIPTGAIDDTDATHSNDVELPSKPPKKDDKRERLIKAIGDAKDLERLSELEQYCTDDELKSILATAKEKL